MSGVDRYVCGEPKKSEDELNLEEEIEELKPYVKKIKEDLAVTEALARISLLTPVSASTRLTFKRMQMVNAEEFMPPRMVLIYLVRMGSFQSNPKIMNSDSQDDSFIISPEITREKLIEMCQNKRNSSVPLTSRIFDFIKRDVVRKNSGNLRVLQWNILSQTLGLQCDSFVKCPKEALAWDYRKYHIIEEIVRCDPDVVCLQEVDHFSFINKVLHTQGFEGHFYEKPDSPCIYIQGNNGPDGCAIFYKKDKYECLAVHSRVLEVWKVKSNQVVIMAILRCKNTGREVCVVGTHLKAKKGALLMHLRNEQARDLLAFVSELSQGRPVVICGDFNGEPNEMFYKSVLSNRDIKLSSSYAKFNKLSAGVDPSDIFDDDAFESQYTTWKIRENGEECHTIDYIFYSDQFLNIEGVLKIPTSSEIGENRVPSFSYPSDHFALVSDFSFGHSFL